MVRGCRGGRRRGARGRGATPPVASTPEGSNPQGEEQVFGQGEDCCKGCGWSDKVLPGKCQRP
jgi:hypothetical protein